MWSNRITDRCLGFAGASYGLTLAILAWYQGDMRTALLGALGFILAAILVSRTYRDYKN